MTYSAPLRQRVLPLARAGSPWKQSPTPLSSEISASRDDRDRKSQEFQFRRGREDGEPSETDEVEGTAGGVIPRGSRILQEPESTTRDTCSERQEHLASRSFVKLDYERSNLVHPWSPADSQNSIFERSAFVLNPREVRGDRSNAGRYLWSEERRHSGQGTPPKWHRHQAH